MNTKKQLEREMQIRECAAAGLTSYEAAEYIGVGYNVVRTYARILGIDFKRSYTHRDKAVVKRREDRAEGMASMFRSGMTLQQIGDVYGVTRERVRQVLKKTAGLTGSDGGAAVKAKARRKQIRNKREARCMRERGCTYSQYKSLVNLGYKMRAAGRGYDQTPTGAFSRQKVNAAHRGIGWNLKLWEWWTIWQESGKWNSRGREVGNYVMCRRGDTGDYEIGNVYIATVTHNCTVQPNNTRRVDHPNHERVIKERASA
jgi:DNA-binding CsgD family transcriptional regulator